MNSKGCVMHLGVVLWRIGKHVLCIVNFVLLSHYGESNLSHLKMKPHKRGLHHEFKVLCHELPWGCFVEGGKALGLIDRIAIQ